MAAVVSALTARYDLSDFLQQYVWKWGNFNGIKSETGTTD